MSTEEHDNIIKSSIRWAKSLGYKVIDNNLGTEPGADAIFQNHAGEKAIFEVVSGGDFTKLFRKQRIREALKDRMVVGVIVVGDKLHNLNKHGKEAGLSGELFESGNKKQKIFGVLARDFDKTIPALLVSVLGTKGSPNRVIIH